MLDPYRLFGLGINPVYHHLYNFGTTGLFVAIGKEKHVPVVDFEELKVGKVMNLGINMDERFCDGLYFALSLRLLRKFMKNPHLLEKPFEAKEEDVE